LNNTEEIPRRCWEITIRTRRALLTLTIVVAAPPTRETDAVIRTVDLVISGDGRAALATAVEALQRGRRVLIVLRSRDARLARRFRRRVCRTARAGANQVTVMTRAEVVCVDGVDGVEAVVIRYLSTGRLCAVNASAFLSCDTHHSVIGRV
jgi:hypothetical protein